MTSQAVEKERRIEALLRFSEKARTTLSSTPIPASVSKLSKEFQTHIDSFPSRIGSSKTVKHADVDTEGLTLWNLCTRLMRQRDETATKSPHDVLLVARVFAFILLDIANAKYDGKPDKVVRLLKVALKAAKCCIDSSRFDYAFKVLEKAAIYHEHLEKAAADTKTSKDDKQMYQKLQAEYYIIRTALAWKGDQLAIAELMYNKAALAWRLLDPDTAEKLADLLYTMGQDYLKKKKNDLAVKWLKRAYEALSAHELDKLGIHAESLRTGITQSRVQALLALGTEEAFTQARIMVEVLENEIGGDRLLVLLLRLELLNQPQNPAFDMGAYGDIVHKIIRTVQLTESKFKLVMHHIRKLNEKAPSLACNMLDNFLQARLFKAGNESQLETAIVNRVWMSTSRKDGGDTLKSVQSLLDSVADNMRKPLSLSSTHACQTLLWKRVEANCTEASPELAEKWCRLALHKVFEDSGDLNKAKISRKLLVIALQRHDISDVHNLIADIPESAREDPNTQFLLFKVALRTDQSGLAVQALDKVYTHAKKDATLLYACVLDAQQNGDRQITMKSLQMVLEKYEYSAPDGVHLPALLRCTIRLVLAQVDANDVPEEQKPALVEELCRLFDGAASKAQKVFKQADPKEKELWTVPELDWFSKNAYNLALKYASSWPPRLVLSLARSCLIFGSVYPSSLPAAVQDDILLRGMFCDFLASVLLIALARPEDNVEEQLQLYLELRKHVAAFDEKLQSKIEQLEDGPKADLLKKLEKLLIYDFEAAIRLKDLDGMGDCVLKSESCESIKVYQKMCDILLAAQKDGDVQTDKALDILKRIINAAWSLTTFPITTLARYMRCLFRLSLSPSISANISIGLLTQMLSLASQSKDTETPYPDDELEYLATTSFNKAVDFYCMEDDDNCKLWAEKAVDVAGFMGDGGALRGMLQERLVGLRFDREEL